MGEWAVATQGVGRGSRTELDREQRFPRSVGLLYAAFTTQGGFRANGGEYKLMGLAPYGRPSYAERILERLLDLKDDGSFHPAMRYFDFHRRLRMTSRRFDALFGGPPRLPEGPLDQRTMDLAASIQGVTETIVLRMERALHRRTGQRNLCMGGGVALNCVANGRLLREGPFERIWVQPAARDAGSALGAALFAWHQMSALGRVTQSGDGQRGSLLGPAYAPDAIRAFLTGMGAVFDPVDEAAPADRLGDGRCGDTGVGARHGQTSSRPGHTVAGGGGGWVQDGSCRLRAHHPQRPIVPDTTATPLRTRASTTAPSRPIIEGGHRSNRESPWSQGRAHRGRPPRR